jgi:hypothetical protein
MTSLPSGAIDWSSQIAGRGRQAGATFMGTVGKNSSRAVLGTLGLAVEMQPAWPDQAEESHREVVAGQAMLERVVEPVLRVPRPARRVCQPAKFHQLRGR